MEFFIITLVVIAAWHAVYEGIVAPTIRLRLRLHMFEIRDELRSLKIDCGDLVNDKAFRLMEESINNVIKLMALITFSEVFKAQESVARDQQLKAAVENRLKLLDSCVNPAFQSIRVRSARIFSAALAVNGGGWAIYILPLLMVWYLYTRMTDSLRGLMSVPGKNVDQLFGRHMGAA